MSHGSTTRARYPAPKADEVEEPLRSIQSREGPVSTGGFSWRPLLQPLIASWPLLLIGLLVGPAIVAFQQSRAPVTYTAEALVAPNRTRTQVQFVPQIKTVDDTSGATGPIGISAERRQALVDLVRSSNIEARVISELSGKLPDESLQRGTLTRQVSGIIRPRSEILSIQAIAASSPEAMLIANSWARNYVDEINRLYSPSGRDNSVDILRDQAQRDLAAAQAALSESIGASQLESLNQQIQQRQALLNLLQSPYQSNDPLPADTKATTSTSATAQSQSSNPVLNDYRLAERRTLDDLSQTLRRIDATRQNVRALLSQAQVTGTSGSSDAAALALLKTQLVAITDGIPSQLQLQIPTGGGGSTADELQALANSLDTARGELAREFDVRRAAYELSSGQAVNELERQLQDLRARRESADAERKGLVASRDLAAETYTALAKKAEEQRVASSTAGHEVEMASEATFAAPLPRQAITSLIAAAVIGLVVAAVVAYGRWLVFGPGRRSLEAKTAW